MAFYNPYSYTGTPYQQYQPYPPASQIAQTAQLENFIRANAPAAAATAG